MARGRRYGQWGLSLAAVIGGGALLAFGLWPADEPGSADPLAPATPAENRPSPVNRAPRFFAAPEVPEGGVNGTVVDPEGVGIPGATVCARCVALTCRHADPICVPGGEDGAYRLEALAAASYQLSAAADGFVPGAWLDESKQDTLFLRADDVRTGVDIELTPGGVELAGVVQDPYGEPLVAANVTAWLTTSSLAVGATARTDTAGRFVLWVAPGWVRLTGRAEGHASAEQRARAPSQRVVIQLEQAGLLCGVVVAAGDGTPVQEVRVSLESTSPGRLQPLSPTAVTDLEGRFALEGLEPGRYRPSVRDRGWYGRADSSTLLGPLERSPEILIEVRPGLVVTGRVLLVGSERPCPAGRVRLVDDTLGERAIAELDADGAAHFDTVPPGLYVPQIHCPGYRPVSDQPVVPVEDHDLLDIRWWVEPALSVVGTVTVESGEPVAGVGVRAKRDGLGPRLGTTRVVSAADGSFVFADLAPGDYRISARIEGAEVGEAQEVELRTGEEPPPIHLVIVQPGSLGVSVLTPDEEPLAGFVVELRRSGEAEDKSRRRTAPTDSEGRATFGGLPAGDVEVAARHPAAKRASEPETVTVIPGEMTRVTLVIEPPEGSINGRVLEADGSPLPEAVVEVVRLKGPGAVIGASNNWQTRSDDSGAFTLTGLPLGRHRLRATHYSGASATQEAETGNEVEIRVRATASVAGILLVGAGSLPALFSLRAVREGRPAARQRESFWYTDGSWEMTGLRPGRWTLTAETPIGAGRREVELRPGEERHGIQILLVTRGEVHGRLVAADTQEPLAGVTVRLRSRPSASGSEVAGDRSVATDLEGLFRIEGVPNGGAKLEITPPPGYTRPLGIFLTVPAGQSRNLGDLQLEPDPLAEGGERGMLGFRVHWPPTGKRVADYRVKVMDVRPGSPAALAGLRAGNVIIGVNGVPITGPNHYLFWGLVRTTRDTVMELTLADGRVLVIVAGEWGWP